MKKKLFRSLTLLFSLLLSFDSFAQSGMEEYFYESGKIKVVIAVAMIVLSGIFTYLFILDRKVSKLEEKMNQDKSKKR